MKVNMKGYLLIVLCLIFLALSLSINGAFAAVIKEIIVWGGFIFLVLVLREVRKLTASRGKSDKWDEDP